jgi:hypothetical protein
MIFMRKRWVPWQVVIFYFALEQQLWLFQMGSMLDDRIQLSPWSNPFLREL